MYEIKLKIKNESDLYNSLDPDAGLLSDDVTSYLQKKYTEKTDLLEQTAIHIFSDEMLDEERVRKNFASYTQNELSLLAKRKKRSLVKEIWLFILGVFFIAFWLLLESVTESIAATVVCIVGWFAVWEAANIWLVESPAMRLEKIRLKKMEKTEIIFSRISENLNENNEIVINS